jgi:hypothetical protein
MGGPTIVHGSVSGAETPRGYQEDGDQELPDDTPHHLPTQLPRSMPDLRLWYRSARVVVMRTLRLSTVGAVCALGTVVCFLVGAVAMGSSGMGVLIPETGRPGLDWIAAVDAASWLFFAGAWLVVLVGLLGVVALVGFYDTLRLAGPVMILGRFSAPSG